MNGLFKDRTVLITGASAGFGESMAEHFAREGASLILIARRKEKLEAVASKLRKLTSGQVFIIIADVSNLAILQREITKLPDSLCVPDILINNAGLVRGLNKLWETLPSQWNEMIDTNVKGILNVCSLFIPRMLKRNSGHIINVGSISGHDTYPGGSVYCATKYAVTALTETLRKELVATPIRVSMISPGMAKTEFSEVRFPDDPERAKSVYENIQALTADDIAEIVVFMASRPPHVTIADVVVFPTNQASVSLIHRNLGSN